MSPQAGQILSHYRLEKEIGRDGMGVVYRALNTRSTRPTMIPGSRSCGEDLVCRHDESQVLFWVFDLEAAIVSLNGNPWTIWG